jgi:hypothetical protein
MGADLSEYTHPFLDAEQGPYVSSYWPHVCAALCVLVRGLAF